MLAGLAVAAVVAVVVVAVEVVVISFACYANEMRRYLWPWRHREKEEIKSSNASRARQRKNRRQAQYANEPRPKASAICKCASAGGDVSFVSDAPHNFTTDEYVNEVTFESHHHHHHRVIVTLPSFTAFRPVFRSKPFEFHCDSLLFLFCFLLVFWFFFCENSDPSDRLLPAFSSPLYRVVAGDPSYANEPHANEARVRFRIVFSRRLAPFFCFLRRVPILDSGHFRYGRRMVPFPSLPSFTYFSLFCFAFFVFVPSAVEFYLVLPSYGWPK